MKNNKNKKTVYGLHGLFLCDMVTEQKEILFYTNQKKEEILWQKERQKCYKKNVWLVVLV